MPVTTKNHFSALIIIVTGILMCAQSLLFAETDSLAVTDEEFYVDSIQIVGNEITEDFIILRELTFKEGDRIKSSDLRFNRERVFSLRLFNKVEIYAVYRDVRTIIYIDVKESWYIYPVPFLRRHNESKKLSYGINFSYMNFRGRNENLRTVVRLGYDPYFSISYDNPALIHESNMGFGFGLSYSKPGNKSDNAARLYGGDFDNKIYSTNFTLLKRIDQFKSIYTNIAFQYIEVPHKIFSGISASGTPIDRILSLAIGFNYDTRDLKQFSQNGIYSSISLRHKGFGITGINYNIFDLDFRQYRKIVEELSARWRFALRHTFGNGVPFYDYSYLGYDEYVRGNSNANREGNNLILTSLEVSYPVLKEFDFSIKLPLLPERLTSARIGIYISAFADAGHAFNNRERFKLSEFYGGYGVGVTFLVLPYNALRLEYAIGQNGKGEVLIGTGFSF